MDLVMVNSVEEMVGFVTKEVASIAVVVVATAASASEIVAALSSAVS